MNINPLHCIDFYKSGHIYQYPPGTEYVYSNFTPRSSLTGNETEIIWFGLQYFISSFLIKTWNEEFFQKDLQTIIQKYKHRMDTSLGKDVIKTEHIEYLHSLGYLPIIIKALPEGTKVPFKVPVLTIMNTDPKCFWLTNYLETVMSNMLWKMSTSATTAYQFKQLLNKYADGTIGNRNFVSYQAHDFSFRGMSGIEDAAMSGAGHLTSFYGTDTVPAVDLLEDFYQGSVSDIIGISVPATEHSVMCAGSKDGEFETFKRLITEVYPSGPISIVSDTWDLWTVLNDYLPRLRSEILNRKGRIIIRPDSGDPVDISLKTVEILYKNFPGKTSKRGYERMHDNLGVIYGDGITLKRCEAILKGLKKRGLSSDNMVFGIGSYTYQYKTRDNLGWAVKSTAVCINGEWQPIQKDPVTDTGNKKSAKGFLKVINYDGFELVDNLYYNYKTEDDCLDIVFRNGSLVSETSLEKIRKRIND